jgi:sigma-B regulation protein RsbU (phosphoserine phosphatase)
MVEHQQQTISGLADIQRLLQPTEARIRGLDFALHWQPADTAAGDYYDLMSLSHIIDDFEDRGADAWGMMVADVSGHGAAAAMEAVQFDAILRTYGGDEEPGGPAGALNYANRHFFSRRQRSHFLTVFGGAGRPDLGVFRFVNGGHLPALRRRDGAIDWLGRDDDAGIPLGILREHRWHNVDADLRAGDLLVIYTDGIAEARDRAGRMFGNERIAELVGTGSDAPDQVLARIREALFEHQDSDTGVDDQTLLVLRQEVM